MASRQKIANKAASARTAVLLLFIGLIAIAAVLHTGIGGYCSSGIFGVSSLCLLGALQAVLAGQSPTSEFWLAAGVTLLGVVLLGRFFCAWVCPGALLRGPAKGKNGANSNGDNHGTTHRYTPFAVLGGALLSSLIFGFPVFCLICPVGLTLGAIYAVVRLFVHQQPSLELLVFPALLGVEFLLLKRWCTSICPLGALLSLAGRLNLSLRPAVRKDKCLTSRGTNCQVCKNVCSERIHLPAETGAVAPGNCTKCLECYEKCPVGAIEIKMLTALGRKEEQDRVHSN